MAPPPRPICSFLLYSALNSEPPGYSCIKGNNSNSAWVQVGLGAGRLGVIPEAGLGREVPQLSQP